MIRRRFVFSQVVVLVDRLIEKDVNDLLSFSGVYDDVLQGTKQITVLINFETFGGGFACPVKKVREEYGHFRSEADKAVKRNQARRRRRTPPPSVILAGLLHVVVASCRRAALRHVLLYQC